MSRRWMSGCVVSLLLAGAAVAAESPVLGRWDVMIEGQAPAWVGFQQKDGQPATTFLWGGGSPREIKDVKIDGESFTFKSHDRTWQGKVQGDTMSGTAAKENGDTLKFTGKRVVTKVDVTGTWKAAARGRRAANAGRTAPEIKLQQKGKEVSGELGGRRAQPVTDAVLNGNKLTFKAGQAEYKVTVKGDVMEGEVTRSGGKNAGTPRPFKAERQREWGEPVELIQGETMDNWEVIGEAKNSKWKMVDGVLTNEDRGANIKTKKKFRDFKLLVEFRVPEKSNSGVYLRGRHEIQVEDSFGREPQPGMCGALYGRITPTINASKKAGDWQTFDVTLIDNFVTIVFNGTTIIDNGEIDGITGGALDNDEGAPGPFYLQGDHGAVEYRKMTVRPLKN